MSNMIGIFKMVRFVGFNVCIFCNTVCAQEIIVENKQTAKIVARGGLEGFTFKAEAKEFRVRENIDPLIRALLKSYIFDDVKYNNITLGAILEDIEKFLNKRKKLAEGKNAAFLKVSCNKFYKNQKITLITKKICAKTVLEILAEQIACQVEYEKDSILITHNTD